MTKLGIWSSSSPAKRQDFLKGLRTLKKMGVEPLVPRAVDQYACKKLSSYQPFLAGPDQKKLATLKDLWTDRSLDKIMAVRGGSGSNRLLLALEKASFLKSHPKEIWGFSDLTTIQNYLFLRFQYPWVHSPMLTSPALTNANPREAMRWKRVSAPSTIEDFSLKTLYRPAGFQKAQGHIFGGNLRCMLSLMGGPWDERQYSNTNRILFLEDVNEPAYRIDRMLAQISLAKYFSKVSAVVLGHFTKCENYKPLFTEWAQRNGCAIFSGLPAGHDHPNFPISMGVPARLEIGSQNSARLELPRPTLG